MLVGMEEDAGRDIGPERQTPPGEVVGMGLQQPPEKAREIDLGAAGVDEIGGGLVEPARRGDEAVELVEGALDEAESAQRALVLAGKAALQGFQRLADHRDRRL